MKHNPRPREQAREGQSHLRFYRALQQVEALPEAERRAALREANRLLDELLIKEAFRVRAQ
jgi:hypothetical protein